MDFFIWISLGIFGSLLVCAVLVASCALAVARELRLYQRKEADTPIKWDVRSDPRLMDDLPDPATGIWKNNTTRCNPGKYGSVDQGE